MRNVIALAGLAVMAAAVVMGDGGHPYHYETSAGWGDHHHNALVSSRQSPNPLRSRQALAALLTPGVLTAIASLATAIGVSTMQSTAANNRIDDTNRRVGTTESDITKLKKTDTAEAAKVTALETAVGTATTGLTKKVTDLETAVGNDNPTTGLKKDVKDIQDALMLPSPFTGAKVFTALKDTCAKVNSIIGIGNPIRTAPDAALTLSTAAPNPDPVSINLGSTAGSTTLGTYKLTKVLSAITTTVNAENGLDEITSNEIQAFAAGPAPGPAVAQTQDSMAISVTDFNIFRIRVIDAINTLDAKIREIHALGTVTCPT